LGARIANAGEPEPHSRATDIHLRWPLRIEMKEERYRLSGGLGHVHHPCLVSLTGVQMNSAKKELAFGAIRHGGLANLIKVAMSRQEDMSSPRARDKGRKPNEERYSQV
jgi:hypothetical protein